MPNWKKVIVSGSSAALTSVTATAGFTGSLSGSATSSTSASFASTASYVNTLNQTVLITGSLTVGATSAGASENTLTLGARDAANEGGQIGFNAPGGTYTSASFIDNWQNKARILKGNNTTSTGLIAQWDIHTTQMQLAGYTAASSFPGTATANLAVDSGGNVITVSTTGGSVFPYVGNAVITGSLTTTGIIYAQPNGGMYFQGGDDAALYDINVSNHMGIYGVQDSTVASIKLGSGGGIISGKSNNIGIGTINPTSASFQVNGNVWANSFTGSLLGTASYAANGGVTQLLAGPNITLSPTNGLGQVTVSATLSGSTTFNTATGSYGSFYDTTTQTNPVADVPRSMSFNSTDITNGVSISGSTSPFNTYIKTQNAGIYNIQFSAQLDKTDSGTDEVVIWLRKNGIDLTDSATTLTLNGNNDKQVAAWNWFVTSATGDYYQIIWRSLDTDLRLLAEPISGTHPGIPSVILTVNRVDQFLSNTGSFSGSFTGAFTGSLLGTASYASQALSSSYALSASYALNATTSSYALNTLSSSYALSASYARTASYVNPLIQTVTITGSLITSGSDGKGINTSTTELNAGSGTGITVNWGSGQLFDNNSINTVDWLNAYTLTSPSLGGVTTVQWNSGWLKSLTTSMSIDWDSRYAYDSAETRSIDWDARAARDASDLRSIFWNDRLLYDPSEQISVDWNSRTLADSSNAASVEWGSRILYDTIGNIVLSYDSPANGYKIGSATYYLSLLGSQVQEDFTNVPFGGKVNYEGEVIEGVLDGTVVTHDLVYLDTDGKWYRLTQGTDQCTKLLGICVEAPKNFILLEGSLTVTSNISVTDSPYVESLGAGRPIYIKDSSGTNMSTNSPTGSSQYVRVLGHAYYNSTTYTDYWTMKFRPSNDWITI
jgi:hypothetical protein